MWLIEYRQLGANNLIKRLGILALDMAIGLFMAFVTFTLVLVVFAIFNGIGLNNTNIRVLDFVQILAFMAQSNGNIAWVYGLIFLPMLPSFFHLLLLSYTFSFASVGQKLAEPIGDIYGKGKPFKVRHQLHRAVNLALIKAYIVPILLLVAILLVNHVWQQPRGLLLQWGASVLWVFDIG